MPWPSRGWTLGRRTYWAGLAEIRPSMCANRKKPHTVDRRRSIVDGASPLASMAARYSSMCGRVSLRTSSPLAGPGEEHAQVMAVGVQRPTAVPGQEGSRGQLLLVDRDLIVPHSDGHRGLLKCRHHV